MIHHETAIQQNPFHLDGFDWNRDYQNGCSLWMVLLADIHFVITCD